MSPRRTHWTLLTLAGLALGGCTGEIGELPPENVAPEAPVSPEQQPTLPDPPALADPDEPNAPEPPGTPAPDDPWHGAVNVGEGTPAVAVPPEAPPHRARRRMDIDQLSRAIVQATGGIGWTRTSGGQEIDRFEEFAATLGRPDYVEVTQEDLTPSALFQKFLSDAARDVCDKLLERELNPDTVVERVFFTHLQVESDGSLSGDDADITANLAALRLRFHGVAAAPDDPESAELAQLRWLYDSAMHVAGDAAVAWRTVCVGLITHPDFYSY